MRCLNSICNNQYLYRSIMYNKYAGINTYIYIIYINMMLFVSLFRWMDGLHMSLQEMSHLFPLFYGCRIHTSWIIYNVYCQQDTISYILIKCTFDSSWYSFWVSWRLNLSLIRLRCTSVYGHSCESPEDSFWVS